MKNPLLNSVVPEPYPQVTAVLPDTPRIVDPLANMSPTTVDFNLVRIVEDHGPKRLEQIDATIKGLEQKIAKLVEEREKVQALVLALSR